MPIRPELRKYYGRDWRDEIRPRILDRAGNCCEHCGAANGAVGWRDMDGVFHDDPLAYAVRRVWGLSAVQIQIGISHLDHDPANNEDGNLAALCRRCHLIYDRGKHKDTRCARKDAARPLLAEMRG